MVDIPSDLFSNTNRSANANNGVSSNRGNASSSNCDLSKAKNNFAFVTVHKGFIDRVPEGYMVLKQKFFNSGFLTDKKKTGLVVTAPWIKAYRIPTYDMSMIIKPVNDIFDVDNTGLKFHGITLVFSVTSNEEHATKIITQIEGIAQMQSVVSNMITTIVNKGKAEYLESLELDFQDISRLRQKLSFLIDDVFDDLCKNVKDVLDKYGLVIKGIRFGEHDLPKDMEDVFATAKKRAVERDIAKKDADSRLEIAEIDAQAAEKQQKVPFKVIKDFSDQGGLSEKEYYQLMKAQILANGSANVTYVDGLGAGLAPMFNPNNSAQGNQSSNDGPTQNNQSSSNDGPTQNNQSSSNDGPTQNNQSSSNDGPTQGNQHSRGR